MLIDVFSDRQPCFVVKSSFISGHFL